MRSPLPTILDDASPHDVAPMVTAILPQFRKECNRQKVPHRIKACSDSRTVAHKCISTPVLLLECCFPTRMQNFASLPHALLRDLGFCIRSRIASAVICARA
jgi:hypothetical protein